MEKVDEIQVLKEYGLNPSSFPDKKITSHQLISFIKNLHDFYKRPGNSRIYVIIDLDGTLIDNFPRQIAIMEEILIPKFPQLKHLNLDEYIFSNSSKIYSLLPIIKKFTKNPHKYLRIKEIFLESFLSNKFLKYDKIYSGALKVINNIGDNPLSEFIFLTGRPYTSMKKGTLAKLYPLFSSSVQQKMSFFMKPSLQMKDLKYKKEIFQILQSSKKFSQSPKIFIDNEANICQELLHIMKFGLCVHFLSNQSDNATFNGLKLASWH